MTPYAQQGQRRQQHCRTLSPSSLASMKFTSISLSRWFTPAVPKRAGAECVGGLGLGAS